MYFRLWKDTNVTLSRDTMVSEAITTILFAPDSYNAPGTRVLETLSLRDGSLQYGIRTRYVLYRLSRTDEAPAQN